MRDAIEAGPAAVAQLDQRDLFIWLGKIYYGILYKEGFLRRDRKSTSEEVIVPVELLKEYEMHHYFLQAARIPMEFSQFFPASIFVFSVQQPADVRFQFDFRDAPFLAMSLRMGSVGILAALQDGGAQKEGFSDYLSKFQAIELHPLQFLELTAKFFYKTSLFNRVPKYMIVDGRDRLLMIQMPLQGLSAKPVFEEWEQSTYARILAEFTGLPLERLFEPPGRVMTWLYDDNGDLRSLDFEIQPWPI